MNYRHLRSALPLALMAASSMLDCKGGDRAPVLRDPDDAELDMGGRGGGANGGRGGGSSNLGGGSSGAEVDASVDAAGSNCGQVTCSGAGKCEEVDGEARCVCDRGYTLLDGECIVDENCIQLRRLEHGCRLRTFAEPAVGMFFSLETCAGTTVRSDIIGDVTQAFKVKEDNLDLGDESYATVFDRDVESFVMVALDLSESVANDPNLVVPLIGELRTFINAIEPELGEPDVSVGLIVFGRSVHTVQPLTRDFGLIRTALDTLQANPAAAVTEPAGTNLIGAVNAGVSAIEDVQEALYGVRQSDQDPPFRSGGNVGSVLNVGTVVSITDGRDTSGGGLSATPTVVNRISIGISSNIDDVELSRVGPQGSFLAPQPGDWPQAFERVSQRVKEFPNRAYLLSYCSPAVTANHTVVVTLANQQTSADATCSFNAATFGVGVASCNASFVNDYCDTRSCGSFLACRSCVGDAGTARQEDNDTWELGPR